MKYEELTDEKILYIGLQAMNALASLHSKGIYYGDMKP